MFHQDDVMKLISALVDLFTLLRQQFFDSAKFGDDGIAAYW